MWSRIKTILAVTVVAALIWVFAEAESLRTVEAQPDVLFAAEMGSGRVIDVTEPGETGDNKIHATVELEGSASALDAAERALRKAITLTPGMEGVPREPGQHTVALRDALRSCPDLRSRGVTIKKVEPATVRVFVDELESRTLKVIASVSPDQIDGSPDIRPPSVTIRLPRSEAGQLTESSVAVARIDPESLASLTPGRRQTLPGVPLQLPVEVAGSNHATIDPPQADVALTLRALTRSVKLDSVPVHLRIAPGEFGKWDIEIPEQDRFLADVTVTGPGEAVKLIEDKITPVIATLPLSFEELERGIPSKEVVFADLPPGVRADAANKTVRLKIKKRDAAGEKKQ